MSGGEVDETLNSTALPLLDSGSHINAPAERPAATDVCSGHVASPPVRLQPVVSRRYLSVRQEPCPLYFPFAEADLFFETHAAYIDLRLSRRPPHSGNRSFCLGRAPGSLDTTNAFHDDSTGLNFFHHCLLPADARRATE